MMRKFLTILFLLGTITNVRANDFHGVQEMVGRRIPWLEANVVFKELKKVVNSEDVRFKERCNSKSDCHSQRVFSFR